MKEINDKITEVTKTYKKPNGISMYEDDACTNFKSLDCLFSELNEICDEIDNDRLKEIGLVFSEVLKNYHIRQGDVI